MTQKEHRAYWSPLVQQQSSSGICAAEWCRQKAINTKAFGRWKRKFALEERLTATAQPAASWCQVQVKNDPEKAAGLKLLINNNLAIELLPGFDHELLQDVLRILRP